MSQTNWLPVQVFDPATLVNTPSITSIGDSGTWLTYAEYFWDNDPGQGKGTPLTVLPGETFSFGAPSLNALSADVTSFSDGNHNLGLRTKDFSGRWSDTSWLPVRVTFSPVITNQPQNLYVVAGANTSFSVGADGSRPLSYQWFFDGSPLAGAAGPTLSFNDVEAANQGSYYVVITNLDGATNSLTATLTIGIAPEYPRGATEYRGDRGRPGVLQRHGFGNSQLVLPMAVKRSHNCWCHESNLGVEQCFSNQ